jgi:hypothetical protein
MAGRSQRSDIEKYIQSQKVKAKQPRRGRKPKQYQNKGENE